MQGKYRNDSRFRNVAFNGLHGEEITKAAEERDFMVLKAFDHTANIRALALANFTCFSRPEAFILMGGLVNSGKWILEPSETYFEQYLFDVFKGKVKLLKSGMTDKNALSLVQRLLSGRTNTNCFPNVLFCSYRSI